MKETKAARDGHRKGVSKAGGRRYGTHRDGARQDQNIIFGRNPIIEALKSGRDVDKFAACGLHSAPGSVLTDCPILEESPVNLECKVTQVIPLGSHDLFLTEVVACDVDESLLDENGKLCLEKAKLIVYSHGDYLALGKKLGTFGYSVRKKKPVRRKK